MAQKKHVWEKAIEQNFCDKSSSKWLSILLNRMKGMIKNMHSFCLWKPNIQLGSHLTQSNVSFPSFLLIYKMWKTVVLPHRVSERIVDMNRKPNAWYMINSNKCRVFFLPCLSNGDETANSLIHSIVLNKISKDEKQEQKQNTFIGQIPNQRNIYVFSNSFHEA